MVQEKDPSSYQVNETKCENNLIETRALVTHVHLCQRISAKALTERSCRGESEGNVLLQTFTKGVGVCGQSFLVYQWEQFRAAPLLLLLIPVGGGMCS